jgi:hypothetical protein
MSGKGYEDRGLDGLCHASYNTRQESKENEMKKAA